MRLLILVLGITLLAGCAARYPEPIRTDSSELIEFRQAQLNPEQHTGKTARWGGVIASVENSEEQTRIEVVNFRLNNFGRPQVDDQSDGRFVVYKDGFVDPEVYKRGRQVTALGDFSGIEEGAIGDFVYKFPVIQASGVELWQPRRDNRGAVGVGFGYGVYDPFWYGRGFYGPGIHPYHPYYPYYYRHPIRAPRPEVRQREPMHQRNPLPEPIQQQNGSSRERHER
ncbi:starvation-inducible protein [Aliidiomarina minuta]|uniref:Starvation-inducible protein n=1 Tax=Aliidiomarina minuta TaxID=880057 RepID=A0A432W892_9GAMM|nr:Slp family lipoprotein [Aliidiomarina minuta]RUO26176.1 starvation-inducible protein [Aliidiomarina minuta]